MAIHKAAPPIGWDTEPRHQGPGSWIQTCRHCDEEIKRVPGGQGTTWIHTATGAVARTDPETERKRRIEESGHNLWPRD